MNQTSPDSRRTVPESESPPPEQWTPEELVQILNTKSFGPQDPVLKIDVTDIKDRFAKFRDVKRDDGPPAKQARTSLIRATCSLTIWDASSPKQPTIVEQSRKCEIHGKTLVSGERGASIELDSPFLVRLDELQTNKKALTHTSPEVQFSMQLVVMALTETDPWPPVEMTRVPEPKMKSYRDATGLVRFPVLAAKWHKLPRCPQSETESILDLIASQDNSSYRPKLGLKINANWVKSPSPLEVTNSERRARLNLSPGISIPEADGSLSKTDVTMDWQFEGLAKHISPLQFDRYACPFCPGRDLQNPSLLHFHLINSHSLFKYVFTMEFRNDHGRSVAQGTVRVDVSDEYDTDSRDDLRRDHRQNHIRIDWDKPKTPFDLEAYFKGDESWLGKKNKRQVNLLVPRAPSTPRTPRSRSHDASKYEIPLSTITREAVDIPDITQAEKRKFAVPKAPDENTRFFRLTTKRPLEEGEMVSESDDDIDEDWILQKHADTIDSFTDTTREEKEFLQRFDRHMLTEDVSSDLHSSEALVRFCRKYRRWLQGRAMRFEFHKKVATLKIQGCITRKTIMDCIKIIEEPVPNDDPDSMDIDTPVTTPDHAKSIPTTDITFPEFGDIYGRCSVCYQLITHPRTYIHCTNSICPRPDHHITCVSLTQRKPNWLCPVCVTSTPPHSTPPQMFHDAQTSPDAKRLPIRSAESSPDPPVRASRKAHQSNERRRESSDIAGAKRGSAFKPDESNISDRESDEESFRDDHEDDAAESHDEDDEDEYIPDERDDE